MARLVGPRLESAAAQGWNFVQHSLLKPTHEERLYNKISRTASPSEAGLVPSHRILLKDMTPEQKTLSHALV